MTLRLLTKFTTAICADYRVMTTKALAGGRLLKPMSWSVACMKVLASVSCSRCLSVAAQQQKCTSKHRAHS